MHAATSTTYCSQSERHFLGINYNALHGKIWGRTCRKCWKDLSRSARENMGTNMQEMLERPVTLQRVKLVARHWVQQIEMRESDKQAAPQLTLLVTSPSKPKGFNDWGGRGYDDFVPGEVIKTAPSGDETMIPYIGRQACPKFIAFDQEVGQICPRSLPKRGQMCYIPSPPQSLNLSPDIATVIKRCNVL